MNRLNGGQTGGTPWSSRFANILLNKPIKKAPSASFKVARVSSLINAEPEHTFSRQVDECISCVDTNDHEPTAHKPLHNPSKRRPVHYREHAQVAMRQVSPAP
jgi:hypothetical protein